MTDIPAGWYDDPEYPSQFRYWDGAQWTEHRSPKTSATPSGSGGGVWSIVPDAFRLLGRGWRELVVLSLPLVLVMIAAGLLALASLDAALDPGIGDIFERISEPGFDPVNDPDDEAFFESIDVTVDAGSVAGIAVAALLYIVGGIAASVSFTVFLAALRQGRSLSVSQTYGIVLPRLPRILGILLLWTIGAMGVLFVVALVYGIGIVVSPLLLLLLVPLTLAAVIYCYPFGVLAVTALALAPSDDPPLRRTIAMIRPRWGFVAARLLVLTLVFALIGFSSNVVSTPFAAASVSAGIMVSMLLQALQSILSTAGNVVLYDVAAGPLDPAITAPAQTS